MRCLDANSYSSNSKLITRTTFKDQEERRLLACWRSGPGRTNGRHVLVHMNPPAPDILKQAIVRVVIDGDRVPTLTVDRAEQSVRSCVVLRDGLEEREVGR